jgi:hypothetical protein
VSCSGTESEWADESDGTDCFNCCRIPGQLSVVSMSNKMYTMKEVAWFDYFTFLPISPQENNEKMVSSEPSNLRKK